MTIRLECISVDAGDPVAQARWWAEALGWQLGELESDDDEALITAPPGSVQSGSEVLFIRVPEGKSVKNRVHFDLRPDDQAAEIARFEALGATRVDVGQNDDEVTWVVMADPEGNEFCILRASGD